MAAARSFPALALLNRVLLWAVFLTLAVVCVYPMIWLFLNAFKTTNDMFAATWGLPKVWHWENFSTAWNYGISRYLLNSLVVTTATVLIELTLATMAAYALVVLDFRAKAAIYTLILGGAILPPEVSLIPLFRVMAETGLYNTYFALILPNVAFGLPFTTFLIRAYMIDLPTEVDEAAVLDGASRGQIFWQIILPMCRPILVSAALLQALFAWNEFVFALVFLSDGELKTLPVGLMDMQSRLLTNWPVQFAGLTMAALPMLVLFLIGQRQFLRGLSDGMGK